MLKLNVQDLVKVLTIDDSGVCEDGSKRTWVKCSALSFFDEEETYISLFAFGYIADMILDNHTGDNMRRAFVSGTLEIEESYEIVKVDFNGKSKSIKVPKNNYKIVADTLKFIDKNTWGETENSTTGYTLSDDDDEPLDLTISGRSKKNNKSEIAATSASHSDKEIIFDDEEEEEEEVSSKKPRSRRARQPREPRQLRKSR